MLYFSVGELCFPDEGWLEPVDAVLSQWLPGLISFLQNHTDTCRLDFMDGPYYTMLRRKQDGCVYASFLRQKLEVMPETEIDLCDFTQSVAKCLHTYQHMLCEMGYAVGFSREIAVLNQILHLN